MARPLQEGAFDPISQAPPDNESTLGLLRRLMDELATLFRQEMALATAEVTGAIGKVSVALVSMLSGGAVLFAGFLVLLAAATLGLAEVVEPWLAALIVGGVVTLIGIVLLLIGKKALDPSQLKPKRVAASLREDKDVLTRSRS